MYFLDLSFIIWSTYKEAFPGPGVDQLLCETNDYLMVAVDFKRQPGYYDEYWEWNAVNSIFPPTALRLVQKSISEHSVMHPFIPVPDKTLSCGCDS